MHGRQQDAPTAQVWSAESGACLRTVETAGHGLCALFAPGGRHAVVGTKEGAIDILDVGAATVVETLPAHTSAVRPPPATCTLRLRSASYEAKLHMWQVVGGCMSSSCSPEEKRGGEGKAEAYPGWLCAATLPVACRCGRWWPKRRGEPKQEALLGWLSR